MYFLQFFDCSAFVHSVGVVVVLNEGTFVILFLQRQAVLGENFTPFLDSPCTKNGVEHFFIFSPAF
jgi:hypothetical protein